MAFFLEHCRDDPRGIDLGESTPSQECRPILVGTGDAPLACCQRRYKMGPGTGLKRGQLVQSNSLGLRLGTIGSGEAAVAERKPISRCR